MCFLILSCRNNELGYSLDLTHGVCCHFEETRPEHKGHCCLQKEVGVAGHEFSRWLTMVEVTAGGIKFINLVYYPPVMCKVIENHGAVLKANVYVEYKND